MGLVVRFLVTVILFSLGAVIIGGALLGLVFGVAVPASHTPSNIEVQLDIFLFLAFLRLL